MMYASLAQSGLVAFKELTAVRGVDLTLRAAAFCLLLLCELQRTNYYPGARCSVYALHRDFLLNATR